MFNILRQWPLILLSSMLTEPVSFVCFYKQKVNMNKLFINKFWHIECIDLILFFWGANKANN